MTPTFEEAFANHFTVFIAWRMLGGVAIGLASNLSPMYIAEIARADSPQARFHQPTHYRRRHPAGAIHQLVSCAQPAAGRHGRIHPQLLVWR
jgi:hypothetical protein